MTHRATTLREDVRFQILRTLERHPEYSQREIAEQLGISLGAVNYVLQALVSKGHVKVSNFRRSDRKLRYAYVLTPTGIAERAKLAGGFLRRKLLEYDAIRSEIDALIAEGALEPDRVDPLLRPVSK